MLKTMLIREYITVKQAAEMLGYRWQTVGKWCRDNKIESTFDEKGHRHIPKDIIEKMLKKQ